MSSLLVDLILFGMAYVVLVYFVATMTKSGMSKNSDSNDDGDGGVDSFNPPKIDLPPGVIWYSDLHKKKSKRERLGV